MSRENSRVLIFGGTTEGRQLAQILAKNKIPCTLCVATEYGRQASEVSGLPKDELSFVSVRTGRLDKNQMESLSISGGYSAVIDATHPFAAEATKNIRESFCKKTKVIRLERNTRHIEEKNIEYFKDAEECAWALEKFVQENKDSRILLTTGSKNLPVFCRSSSLKSHLVARVLPSLESIKICGENGLEGRQIIAMQGPFSEKMNRIQIQDFKISLLVTKESGRAGGTDEKIEAAKNCGIKCMVIKNIQNKAAESFEERANYIKTSSVRETCETLGGILGRKIEACGALTVFLCGKGMGSLENMTQEAQEAVKNADFVFGAPRMIENIETAAQKFPFYRAKDIIPILEKAAVENVENASAAVLFSGDTGFFSGASKLQAGLKKIKNAKVKILPGISSLSYLSAKIGISYENAKIVSAHGVEEKIWESEIKNALENFKDGDKIFFLTSSAKDVKKIGEIVKTVKNNIHLNDDFKIVLGFNLSYSGEKIISLSPDECGKIEEAGLCSGFILKEEK